MLKEMIFVVIIEICVWLGVDDWCVSVFKDNVGIVKFDDEMNLVFKVEMYNCFLVFELYGGVNMGIGGVIWDILGIGFGVKLIVNIDVFCFVDFDFVVFELLFGVFYLKWIMYGVVVGVCDYGNCMGILMVNGVIYFDVCYVGNLFVFCGNVGFFLVDKLFKEFKVNDFIVVIGGRIGCDGIYGVMFSSVELMSESEVFFGGVV